MSDAKRLQFPSAADTRKRRLWMEMVHWLKIELNSRFGLVAHDRDAMLSLEEMAHTIIDSGELFDKEIQKQLEQCEKAIHSADSLMLRTPVFVKTPPDAVMGAADVIALYDRLAGINDEIEVGEDGYARFGSVNDRDAFREIVREIEDRRNALVFPAAGETP